MTWRNSIGGEGGFGVVLAISWILQRGECCSSRADEILIFQVLGSFCFFFFLLGLCELKKAFGIFFVLVTRFLHISKFSIRLKYN